MSRSIIAIAVLAVLLTGCGRNPMDRALTGGAIGAGLGATAGAATGGSVTDGALLGGAAGAATGALTKKRNLNLGRPIWR